MKIDQNIGGMRLYRQYVDCEYGQVHVRVAAPDKPKYPPLICLHQSPKSSWEFARFLEIAGHDRMVIVPDYPGYGESDHPPAEPLVQIEDYARVMWQVADALDITEQVDLFGNHTGSMVAAEMAHQRGDNVRHIGLISAPIMTAEERQEFDAFFQPTPMDEEGTRFKIMWERMLDQRSEGLTLETMAMSFAENLRGGEAYEWGHHAAFAYAEYLPEKIKALPHKIIVFNPKDMLYEMTPRASPLIQNGRVIDCPQWAQEVLNVHPQELFEALRREFEN